MNLETYKRIDEMSLTEIEKLIQETPDISKYKLEVTERLGSLAWRIGTAWDKADGIDPLDGLSHLRCVTPNHKSMTYKMRKLVGYSYP